MRSPVSLFKRLLGKQSFVSEDHEALLRQPIPNVQEDLAGKRGGGGGEKIIKWKGECLWSSEMTD